MSKSCYKDQFFTITELVNNNRFRSAMNWRKNC